MYSIQVWNKRECSFTHTVAWDLLDMVVVPVYISKDGKKRLVIKTTVAILDTGTFKHQCVTMRTKDFRECLFLKRFLCIEEVVKRFTFQNQAHIRLRIRFYLKILTGNRKCSKWLSWLIHSFFKKSMYRKSIKVFLNLM